jgi:hypothetical protein
MHRAIARPPVALACAGCILLAIACNGPTAATDAGSDAAANGSDVGTDAATAPDMARADDGGIGVDAGGDDAGANDDASANVDSGADGGSGPWHDITDSTAWSFFDVQTAVAGSGFGGGAFDGRYVYFAPSGGASNGAVARYDTTSTAGYSNTSSWTSFDASTLTPDAHGFHGAVFDGRYVYFMPETHSVIARYDTTAATGFANAASWTSFDLTAVASGLSFAGGVFDGRYVTCVPSSLSGANGTTARYDTTSAAGFADVSSWTTFDLRTLPGAPADFTGAVSDGHYLYFVPSGNVHLVTRFDTTSTAGFQAAASWTTFDVSTIDGRVESYAGGSFDGRYVYLAPQGGVAVRYDTTASAGFTAGSSWSTFDAQAVNATARAFEGAAFDGRYVYLVPSTYGVVARFDTAASAGFGDPSSWQFPDLTTLNAGASEFGGAIFDGRYLYLVPHAGAVGTSVIGARFDARVPAAIPTLPGWFTWGPASFL